MTPTRPETVSQEEWDAFNPKQQAFIIEHERIHAVFRETIKREKLLNRIIKEQDNVR